MLAARKPFCSHAFHMQDSFGTESERAMDCQRAWPEKGPRPIFRPKLSHPLNQYRDVSPLAGSTVQYGVGGEAASGLVSDVA